MSGSSESRAYRAGIVVAVVTSLLTMWTTIVRDDGTGMGYFMLIMAAVVGGFSAWFEAAGLARTAVGVAIMQLLLGVATATAPSTASLPGGAVKAVLFNCVFAALWLIAGACFRTVSKRSANALATQQRS